MNVVYVTILSRFSKSMPIVEIHEAMTGHNNKNNIDKPGVNVKIRPALKRRTTSKGTNPEITISYTSLKVSLKVSSDKAMSDKVLSDKVLLDEVSLD
ncbi:2600_t:CDS:2 [Ambispora gerdemannii]|uniref:2600_t:CDS:1 n=1 Tax=Ambispora gerdemannii TaxID=144530 RepID=A0A9N8WQ80_9GLOM|nr:2600_t:CDS:2 [Ambispora gerdemannii]